MTLASKTLTRAGQRYDALVFIAWAAVIAGAAVFIFAVGPALIDRFRVAAGAANRSADALFVLLPAAAAGIAFGGAALGLTTIVRLVREMEANLFAWLAPILAIFSAVLIAGVDFALPISSVQKTHFAVLSAILFVGGGVMALFPGWSHKALAVLLSLLPVAAFVTAYILQEGGVGEAWSSADKGALYVMFLLVATCTAILSIAFSVGSHRAPMFSRDSHSALRSMATSSDPALAATAQEWQPFDDDVGLQHQQLQAQYNALQLEREQFQQYQAEVEQQLRLAVEQHELAVGDQNWMQMSDDERMAKALGRSRFKPLLSVVALLLVVGAAAGGYFGWVRPYEQRMARAAELEKQRADKGQEQIRALVQKLQSQNAEMNKSERELQAARQAETEARTQAEKAAAALAKIEGSAKKKPAATARARRAAGAKRTKRAAVRRKAAAKKGKTVDPTDDDPLAGIL